MVLLSVTWNDREPLGSRRALDRLGVDTEAGAAVDGGGAVADVHPGLGHARVAMRDSSWTPAAVSDTLAAVTKSPFLNPGPC